MIPKSLFSDHVFKFETNYFQEGPTPKINPELKNDFSGLIFTVYVG